MGDIFVYPWWTWCSGNNDPFAGSWFLLTKAQKSLDELLFIGRINSNQVPPLCYAFLHSICPRQSVCNENVGMSTPCSSLFSGQPIKYTRRYRCIRFLRKVHIQLSDGVSVYIYTTLTLLIIQASAIHANCASTDKDTWCGYVLTTLFHKIVLQDLPNNTKV